MADTQRTFAQILALLADNSSGDISPQDIRDALVSIRTDHGQIWVPAAARAAVTISGTVNYYEATTPAWSLTADAQLFDESAGNGRLTYTGIVPVMVHIACTVSFTVAANNQVIHLRLGKSAVTDEASEAIQKLGTGTDVGSTALHLIEVLDPGEYISLWVRNETSAANITIEVANLQVVTMPM